MESGRLAARATPGDARRVALGCPGALDASVPLITTAGGCCSLDSFPFLSPIVRTASPSTTCLSFAYLLCVWMYIYLAAALIYVDDNQPSPFFFFKSQQTNDPSPSSHCLVYITLFPTSPLLFRSFPFLAFLDFLPLFRQKAALWHAPFPPWPPGLYGCYLRHLYAKVYPCRVQALLGSTIAL